MDAFGAAAEVIVNVRPSGFGADHNSAFLRCETPYFYVVNPDVGFASGLFSALTKVLDDRRAAVAGPLVRTHSGQVEYGSRRFLTPGAPPAKLFRRRPGPKFGSGVTGKEC